MEMVKDVQLFTGEKRSGLTPKLHFNSNIIRVYFQQRVKGLQEENNPLTNPH